jgi:hypothetical protein
MWEMQHAYNDIILKSLKKRPLRRRRRRWEENFKDVLTKQDLRIHLAQDGSGDGCCILKFRRALSDLPATERLNINI